MRSAAHYVLPVPQKHGGAIDPSIHHEQSNTALRLASLKSA
jgi:hypothetical protein